MTDFTPHSRPARSRGGVRARYLGTTDKSTEATPKGLLTPRPRLGERGQQLCWDDKGQGELESFLLVNLPSSHTSPSPEHTNFQSHSEHTRPNGVDECSLPSLLMLCPSGGKRACLQWTLRCTCSQTPGDQSSRHGIHPVQCCRMLSQGK